MHLPDHPELLERLAMGYALGTLRGGARRRFEALAREHASVRAAALVWQSRWAGMSELQEEISPSPQLWKRISIELQASKEPATKPVESEDTLFSRLWANVFLWRGASGLGLAATVGAILVGVQALQYHQRQSGVQIAQLRNQLQATPQIQYVAVLSDAHAGASLLVTMDGRDQQLHLQRVSGYREDLEHSLQLWALPPAGAPRSLGVLGRSAQLQLPVDLQALKAVPMLAVSLEPKGGVPGAGGPTGPVLFKGSWIERTL